MLLYSVYVLCALQIWPIFIRLAPISIEQTNRFHATFAMVFGQTNFSASIYLKQGKRMEANTYKKTQRTERSCADKTKKLD